MKTKITLITLIVSILSSCSDTNNTNYSEILEFTYNFKNDSEFWEADFADYPVGEEHSYELSYEFSHLPVPLNTNEGALKLSGNNHSDDLFMFIRKQINELEPNTNYKVSFEIEFASNVADDMIGVGGSPGEGVTIKAGVTLIKPDKVVVAPDYRMNIDKGNQATGGTDMKVIGDFSNDTDHNVYTLKTLVTEAIDIHTDQSGSIWLVVGTDSGFEATTTIYYNTIKVLLKKQ